MLSEFLMESMNPYRPRTGPAPQFKDQSLVDRRPQTWSFRGTPVRVDQAIEIPYFVWYPSPGTDPNAPYNAADWLKMNEKLLVGYVGAGGW
jgi:hypothetical protein